MLSLICTLMVFTSVAGSHGPDVRSEPDRGRENARVTGQAPAAPVLPPRPIFIGVRGTVLAIDHASGQELWRSRLKGSDFVNVALIDGDLYAATHGELFCLDIATGHVRWHTPFKGLGRGLVTIAGNQQSVFTQALKRQQGEAGDATFLMMTVMM